MGNRSARKQSYFLSAAMDIKAVLEYKVSKDAWHT